MIAYRKTNGRAHDAICVPEGYVAKGGEILLDVDSVPPLDTLHDPVPEMVVEQRATDRQIEALESVQRANPRWLRAAALGDAYAINKLRDIETQIAALREARPK